MVQNEQHKKKVSVKTQKLNFVDTGVENKWINSDKKELDSKYFYIVTKDFYFK